MLPIRLTGRYALWKLWYFQLLVASGLLVLFFYGRSNELWRGQGANVGTVGERLNHRSEWRDKKGYSDGMSEDQRREEIRQARLAAIDAANRGRQNSQAKKFRSLMKNTERREHGLHNRFRTVEDIVDYKINYDTEHSLFESAQQQYIVNCSNIDEIVLGWQHGHGAFKVAYEGVFRGIHVAVKVMRHPDAEMYDCVDKMLGSMKHASLDDIRDTLHFKSCYSKDTYSILHEIINHSILDYPNVVKHLGFCIRDYPSDYNITAANEAAKELARQAIAEKRAPPIITDTLHDAAMEGSTNIANMHGIISVYEYGDRINMTALRVSPWIDRVRHCLDLANLLELLHNSLMGSIHLQDYKLTHVLMVDGKLKLTDLDNYVRSVGLRCGTYNHLKHYHARTNTGDRPVARPHQKHTDICPYGTQCIDYTCQGYNVLHNIENFNKTFFYRLLVTDPSPSVPANFNASMTTFFERLGNHSMSVVDIKNFLKEILDEYERQFGTDSLEIW